MATIKENQSRAFDRNSYKSLLKLRYLGSWLSLLLLAILAWIPTRLRDAFAIIVALLASYLPIKIRRVALANISLAYKDKTPKECFRLYQKSLCTGFATLLGYGESCFLPTWMLKKRYNVIGIENLEKAKAKSKAIIFLAPHSFAIDRCGLYLPINGIHTCTMVHKQRNPVYDWYLNYQRTRFGGDVYERSAGLRTLIRELKAGHSCFFLPDEDLGPESSLFVEFMSAPKATVSTLPKLCKLSGATVIQLFSTYNLKTSCYDIYFSEVFENYPSSNLYNDLRKMNKVIEDELLDHGEQYMWFLRFFKTVPDSSYPNIYNVYGSEGWEEAFAKRRQMPKIEKDQKE